MARVKHFCLPAVVVQKDTAVMVYGGGSMMVRTWAISMLAPSMVPMMRQPFMANFMLEVPDASVPAVLMC